ncbi:hypothetical protein QYM36_009529 [Artemia franciscana]|uniref:Glycerate kinase n=1 Tax=Artemia franciscana TaxID=6661 RepID=A0AA88KZW4_ARTSF|nr:hypothetical protein QYM36_009529 [Artemia franciscana]
MDELRKLFMAGIAAVKPQRLISECLSRNSKTLRVNSIQESHSCEMILPDKGVHLFGFGKAASEMMQATIEIIGNENIASGIALVPKQEEELFNYHNWENITTFFGAKGNLPDEDSLKGSQKALKMIEGLDSDDLLLVLISGGGSALFEIPVDGISLNEEVEIVNQLSKSGATIAEINTVRKRLSKVKGGGLARMCKGKIIALIISDVIGDHLDVIASGTTVCNKDSSNAAFDVLSKHNIDVSEEIMNILQQPVCRDEAFEHVFNFLVGSNWHLLTSIRSEAVKGNNLVFILSRGIKGEARSVGKAMMRMMIDLVKVETTCKFEFAEDLGIVLEDDLDLSASFTCTLNRLCRISMVSQKRFIILVGGETTVSVSGSGKGGRCQELALSFLVEVARNMKADPELFKKFKATFLAAGTDGIDGPTDAAGAIVSCDLARHVPFEEAEKSLDNNDSYKFFTGLDSGKYHIKTGPTGTNVMDLLILLIDPIHSDYSCH